MPVNNQPYHRYGSGNLSVVEIYINKGDENAIYENGRHQVSACNLFSYTNLYNQYIAVATVMRKDLEHLRWRHTEEYWEYHGK